jgi:hypothetical protein
MHTLHSELSLQDSKQTDSEEPPPNKMKKALSNHTEINSLSTVISDNKEHRLLYPI